MSTKPEPVWIIHGERQHRLVCADCADPEILDRHLQGRKIAAVVADPPYSSGGIHAAQRRQASGQKYVEKDYMPFSGDFRDQRSWQSWSCRWMTLYFQRSHPETYLFVFTDWRQLPATTDVVQWAEWIWRGVGVWDKGRAARIPHQGYMRHQAEYVVWATAGEMRARYGGQCTDGVRQAAIDRKKVHMTQKPLEAFWFLDLAEDGLIVDPFAGSCSALVAADRRGKSSLSFECNPAVLAAALQRLKDLGFGVQREGDDAVEYGHAQRSLQHA